MTPRAPGPKLSALLAASTAVLAPLARANVVGGDLQNFNPVPGGIDYVTVESSETLEPGYWNLGLMMNHAVNSLPYYEDQAQNRLRYNDALTMADLGIGVGVFPDFEVGLAVQYLVEQHVSEGAAHGEFTDPGVTGYRAYGKYRLLRDRRFGVAATGSVDFNRVLNNPLVGQGGSPIGIAEVDVDTKVGGASVAANVGYRYRHRGSPIAGMQLLPMGNQYIASAGVSYLLPRVDTKLIAEVFGSRPAQGTSTGMEARQSSSAELLAGLKFDATTDLAVHVGGGTELIRGAATPDWRAYAGVNWALGPGTVRRQPATITRSPQASADHAEERTILENVHFATGSDQVPTEAIQALTAIAAELKAAPYDAIVIEGHTDSVGRASSNQKLSERRAAAVRHWFIANAGVDPKRIEAVGYGDTRPIADNGNFQGRERNRRVEVMVRRRGKPLRGTHDQAPAAGELAK